MPRNPIVRRAMAVTLERLLVVGLLHIQEHPSPEHAIDAVNLRAMRILGGFDFRVMLAVNRRPFLRHLAGGEPQPEAEEVRDEWVQLERAVRLTAVQID